MSIKTILKWIAVIAVVAWIVQNPTSASDAVTSVFSGIVTFFKGVFSGVTNAV